MATESNRCYVYDTFFSLNKSNKMKAAEIELRYKNINQNRIVLTRSDQVYQLIIQHYNMESIELFEVVNVIFLNRANHVLGVLKIAQGGTAAAYVDSKLIFATALKAAASSIILVHNHPSGNLKPSQEDISLTENIKKAGATLHIALVDHLIISSESYYSFADNAMI